MDRELASFMDKNPSYSGNVFYQFEKYYIGIGGGKILEIQRIKNIRMLLQVPDVFAFLKANCEETLRFKERICFLTDDFECVVRPGIRSNLGAIHWIRKNVLPIIVV